MWRSGADTPPSYQAASVLLDILHLAPTPLDPLRQRRLHERVELPVEHVGGARRLDAGAQGLDELVGLEDVGADLVAPADVGLRRRLGTRLLLAALELGLVEAGAQHVPGRRPVLVLRALLLAGDDDAGRQMGDAHRRIGGVDVLAAGAGRAVGIDAAVRLLDLYVDLVVDDGVDPDRGEARVPARVRVEGRDAHDPVHA